MSRDYLLRLEAVNLGNLLDDTRQLSVIRGGGLAVLNAVDLVQEELGLDPVTTGASTGIFRFTADDDDAAEERRREVARFLREHRIVFESADKTPRDLGLGLDHATFAVDVAPSSGDFVADREALLAKNRWRQMGAPSVAVPEGASSAGVCAFDRVRPAREGLQGPEGKLLSRSTYERWQYGRAQKQSFYEERTNERFPAGFSQDFDRLTADPNQGPLHHKMAVIYLDGNRFGKIQNEHCTDIERQRTFDEAVQGQRTAFLRELLKEIREGGETADFREDGGDGAIRFETLLWGGDELLWVVPAWRGWWTLRRFYDTAASWEVEFPAETVPLRHGGGLLFCHHSAPIYRIRRLAGQLAEIAKRRAPEENRFAYQVFETFDHAAGDLDGYRRQRSPAGVDHHELILDGAKMGNIQEAAQALRPHLPHRQLIALVRSQVEGDGAGDREAAEKAIERLGGSLPEDLRPTLGQLVEDLGGAEHFALHLSDLWDYL